MTLLPIVIAFAVGSLMGYFCFVLAHNGKDMDLGKLRSEALMFVAAAEKLLPGANGEAKLDYVLAQLDHLGLFNGIDKTIIRAAVEWAVSVWKNDALTYVAGEVAAMDGDPLEAGNDGSI